MSVVDFFSSSLVAYLTVIAVLGLLVGSFLNVVIYRLPVMLERQWEAGCREALNLEPVDRRAAPRFDLIKPDSRCPQCERPIKAYENIPVISFLLLRGKCPGCHSKISWRYPAIEVLTALLSVMVAYQFGVSWVAFWGLILTWGLIALSFIDFDHQILPDVITLPLLWLGLLLSVGSVYVGAGDSILGAVVGYLSLWSVYQVFRLLTGKEGMGFGDFKLLAALGAWLGWQSLPVIVLFSSFAGALIGISLIVALGRDKNVPIPFGPYLAIAGWCALLWGHDITEAYFSFAGL